MKTFFLCVGLLASFMSIIERKDLSIGDDIAAQVNSYRIFNSELNRKLMVSFPDLQIRKSRRSLVLEKLIEEELLLQKAESLDLLRKEKDIRNRMIQRVIANLVQTHENSIVSNFELKRFYRRHFNLFESPLFFRGQYFEGSTEGIDSVIPNLRKGITMFEDFSPLKKKLANFTSLYLPSTKLPLNKIREYLGSSLSQCIKKISVGSACIEKNKSVRIYYLIDKERNIFSFYKNIKLVKYYYQKDLDDKKLHNYLKNLKAEADIKRN